MRQMIVRVLAFSGVLLAGLGLWYAVFPVRVDAQESLEEAEYAGNGECRSCHRDIVRDHSETPHALALQDVERDKDAILADFEQDADIRTVQFPGESELRPFTADDIVYAVGAGRYAQRYLYEVERNVYAVFPAEWDNVAKIWRPMKLAENWPDPAYDWLQNCAGCHATGLNVERGRWEDDGVQCEACHGPGSVHAEVADDAGRRPDEDELVEIHAAIVVSPDAQICGQCHSQGTQPGDAHRYPVNYRPGTDLLQEGMFVLAATDDPVYWWESGHARQNNMQYNEWLVSAHARSLETMKKSADAQDGCVQCHSGDYVFTERIRGLYEDEELSGPPPAMVTLETAQFSLTCTTCHSPHTAGNAEFNLVSAAYDLCTGCHQNTKLTKTLHHPVKEMFEGQAMIEGVEGIASAHFIAEEGPRCTTCHMPAVPAGGFSLASHLWRPVLPGTGSDIPPDSCSVCHSDLTTSDLQSLVEDTQAAVRSRLSIAWVRLASVPPPEPGSEAEHLYGQVVAALTFVQNDGSLGVHNYAYADALLDAAARLLAQLSIPGSSLQPTEAPAPTATPAEPQPVIVTDKTPVSGGFRPMTAILIGTILLILLAGGLIIVRLSRQRPQNREA